MLAYVYAHLSRPKDTLAVIQEYQQFALLPPDLSDHIRAMGSELRRPEPPLP